MPAIISILHRISGFVLFLLIPVVLWALAYSLTEQGFETLQRWLGSFYVKFIFWALFIPFCYHLVAGIRHLLMDIQIGVTLKHSRMMAKLVLFIFILWIILAGIWLW